MFWSLKHCRNPAKRYHVAPISFQRTFFGRLSKCQVVLYTVSEPCLSSKAVGKVLKITVVWKMTSAHAFKSLSSCKYVKGDFLCFINFTLKHSTNKTNNNSKRLSRPHYTSGMVIYSSPSKGPPKRLLNCALQCLPCYQTPEPHGMKWYQTPIAKKTCHCPVRAFDLRPQLDVCVNGITFLQLQCVNSASGNLSCDVVNLWQFCTVVLEAGVWCWVQDHQSQSFHTNNLLI